MSPLQFLDPPPTPGPRRRRQWPSRWGPAYGPWTMAEAGAPTEQVVPPQAPRRAAAPYTIPNILIIKCQDKSVESRINHGTKSSNAPKSCSRMARYLKPGAVHLMVSRPYISGQGRGGNEREWRVGGNEQRQFDYITMLASACYTNIYIYIYLYIYIMLHIYSVYICI